MKKIILFLSVLLLGLTGCSQKDVENIATPIETTKEDNVNLYSSTGGNFTGPIFLDGLRGGIIISGNKLIFEDIFSIRIPPKILEREYEKNISNKKKYQNFILLPDIDGSVFFVSMLDSQNVQQSMTTQDICLLQTNYNGSPTFDKKTIEKTIDTHEVFITQITFFTEGNRPPYYYTYITHFCFAKSGIIYDITFDGYPFLEANQLLTSFTFIN